MRDQYGVHEEVVPFRVEGVQVILEDKVDREFGAGGEEVPGEDAGVVQEHLLLQLAAETTRIELLHLRREGEWGYDRGKRKAFTLLSDILLQSYFALKDSQFESFLDTQLPTAERAARPWWVWLKG